MKRFILLISFFIIVFQIFAQQHITESLEKTIDSIVINQKWVSEVPGVAVGVIVNNRVVSTKAYGVQDLKTAQPLTVQSDFHMASVSKPFAATAILQLVEQGKFHLDSTLAYYLPHFRMRDERYKQITLRHMLTHSSGIPDVQNYEWEKQQTDEGAAERYTKSFAQTVLDFPPGSKFNYSNAAYNILADVIAKASGQSFEQYMKEHIFMPVGMDESSFLLNDIPPVRRTGPHIIDQHLSQAVSTVYPYNRIHAPSSTLHSNIEDMLQWLSCYLHKGAVKGKVILKDTTWQDMLQPRLKVNDQYSVCLSWFQTMVGEHKIYFHSGADLGYRSFAGFDPKNKVAVVIMGNNESFDATGAAFSIFESVLLHAPAIPESKPLYWELKDHVLSGGIKKVKEIYYDKKKQHPHEYNFSAGSLVTLANLLYDRGYKQQAIDVLIFCTELEPGVSRWYEYLGDVYHAWGKKEQALEWFKKALSVDATNKGIEEKIKGLQR